jgi:protein-disulfide isomerase/uncharacterized membrane protein
VQPRSRLAVPALLLSLVGLGASLASLVDFLAPAPTFCAESGCATVRASAWAHPLGIPMPVLGVAFFATMIALAVVSRPRLRFALAIAGAAWATGLIALQAFAIGAWCKLCMVADPAAIALAVVVVAGAGTVRFTWRRGALALPAIAVLPAVFAIVPHEPAPSLPGVPDVIAREQIAGEVTIVEFLDFECPFCRELAPKLAAAVEEAAMPVRVIRKMVPLRIHPHAHDAALAWCCADAQGKGDAMATALFAAPPEDLTPEGCERLAAQVGCDIEQYRAQLADPATEERLAHDLADARAAGVRGFPTVFIGDQRVSGASHETAELLAAIDHARR